MEGEKSELWAPAQQVLGKEHSAERTYPPSGLRGPGWMWSGLALKLTFILFENYLTAHAFPDHSSIWNEMLLLESWEIGSAWYTFPVSASRLSLVEQKGHKLPRGPRQTCFHVPTSVHIGHVWRTSYLISLRLASFLPSFSPSFLSSILFLFPPSLLSFFLKQTLTECQTLA